MSAGEIAGVTVEAALEQIRVAFAERPMPVDVVYYSRYHDSDEMARLFNSPPAALSNDDLDFLMTESYWGGLDWPELAYYIPEILTRRALGSGFGEDMLLYKLMLATRPDLTFIGDKKVSAYTHENMNLAEREAVFAYVQAIFDVRLHTLSYRDNEDKFREIFAFLINFDGCITPFLERWKRTDDPQARVNLCLFVTDYFLNYSDGRRFIIGTYYDKNTAPLPENQVSFDALMAPESAASLLMNCAEDVENVGPEWQTGIGAAFDWAMTLAQTERRNAPDSV